MRGPRNQLPSDYQARCEGYEYEARVIDARYTAKVRGAQNIREDQVRAQGATQRTMIETQMQRARQAREM